jgi:glycosyltransferase involved in cell wall biosynthesis
MRALLVDPSLFIAPYDAALSAGLTEAGVTPHWATRALRPNEEAELPHDAIRMHFYRLTDGRQPLRGRLSKYVKGAEHVLDMLRLERLARDYDVVHMQFAVLPMLDVHMMRRIRRHRPVILTVHDTTPFNGAEVSGLQVRGLDASFHAADALIVHTDGARRALSARGIPDAKISVIPHGPMTLKDKPAPVHDKRSGRWRIVLFGRLQPYKGIDMLIDALASLPLDQRERLEVIVAGEPLMPMEPLTDRAAQAGLSAPTLQFRIGRLSGQEMADLLGSADTFVLPYRAIEASGVLFLIASMRKWIVASALGAFVDALGQDGVSCGTLVEPGRADMLADALIDSIGREPGASDLSWAPPWHEIGERTASLYRRLSR